LSAGIVLGGGCSTSGGSGAGQAPMPELASYDRSCTLDSDCTLVDAPECAHCTQAALGVKDAPRYAEALGEARKTETCLRAIERSAPCLPPPAVARCVSALCALAEPPAVADAGEAGASSDASSDASLE
jgi:hypothetical protein